MTNGLTRGIPAQELLENQDPAVLFNYDEVHKTVTPIERPEAAPEPEPKKAAAKKVTARAAKGEGE